MDSKSSTYIFWRRFKRNKGALLGLVIVVALIFVSIFAAYLAPQNPNRLNLEESYTPPDSNNLLGTDEFGRDVLSRILYGSRIVVGVALLATLLASVIGILLGLMAGYYGGTVDIIITRVIDILLAFPGFLLAIALVAILGTNVLNIIFVIAITRIPRYARLVRGAAFSVAEKEYVESAKALGIPTIRILLFHVLPNCVGPIIVYASLTLGDSILTVSGLSFLGIGIQPPTSDWGVMLTRGREYLLVAPWMAFFPGLAIFFTVMGFNLLGDGLRDAFDPKEY